MFDQPWNPGRMSVCIGAFMLMMLFLNPPVYGQDETGDAYLIGPEDILEISVWRDDDLTKKVIVRPDGKISFPLIGEVPAGGHSVQWLREEIRRRISDYVPDAVVTVMVLQVNGMKVFVVGKVNKPGASPLGRRTNVMQALAMAGGLTPFANENDILVLRESQQAAQEVIRFNYSEVKKGENIEQNIWLRDGDVIVVR